LIEKIDAWRAQQRVLPSRAVACPTASPAEPSRGYQRDHYVSLELLAPDIPANVHYQALTLAHVNDGDEHAAGSRYCAGKLPPGDGWLGMEPLEANRAWLAGAGRSTPRTATTA
jgi:hypothetical protein